MASMETTLSRRNTSPTTWRAVTKEISARIHDALGAGRPQAGVGFLHDLIDVTVRQPPHPTREPATHVCLVRQHFPREPANMFTAVHLDCDMNWQQVKRRFLAFCRSPSGSFDEPSSRNSTLGSPAPSTFNTRRGRPCLSASRTTESSSTLPANRRSPCGPQVFASVHHFRADFFPLGVGLALAARSLSSIAGSMDSLGRSQTLQPGGAFAVLFAVHEADGLVLLVLIEHQAGAGAAICRRPSRRRRSCRRLHRRAR